MVDTPLATAHAAAIEAEYGKYVAKVAIDVGGARAFNPGDPVPASSVESGSIPRELVVGSNSKTAQSVAEKD